MIDKNGITLPSDWAKASTNPIVVAEDSYDNKNVEEQMNQEEFIDSKEEWTVSVSRGPKDKGMDPQ